VLAFQVGSDFWTIPQLCLSVFDENGFLLIDRQPNSSTFERQLSTNLYIFAAVS